MGGAVRPAAVIGFLALGAAVVLLVVVLVGADPPAEPEPADQAATPTPTPIEPTPTPTPTAEPTPGEPTPTPTPTPTPGPEPEPLIGSSAVTDDTGDVVDSAGTPPPQPAGAADLVAVTLEGDGSVLRITFEMAEAPPDAIDFLVWAVELWDEDELAYTVSVQQAHTDRVAGVFDWQAQELTGLDEPQVDGNTLRVEVRREDIPRLGAGFTWQARTQLDGGYEDAAPPDPDRATFPDS